MKKLSIVIGMLVGDTMGSWSSSPRTLSPYEEIDWSDEDQENADPNTSGDELWDELLGSSSLSIDNLSSDLSPRADTEPVLDATDPIAQALTQAGLWRNNGPTSKKIQNGKYTLTLVSYIEAGGNGLLFKARNSDGDLFAVKLVVRSAELGADDLALEHAALTALGNVAGVVRVWGPLGTLSNQRTGHTIEFMVMDLLDKSFGERSGMMGSHSLDARSKFVAKFAYYAVLTLKKLHDRGYAHCDIHQGAFMTLVGDNSSFRLIDLGKVKKYRNSSRMQRRVIDSQGKWIGTENLKLLSLFELKGYPCRPRDDLIRLGETLVMEWPSSLSQRGARHHLETLTDKGDINALIEWKKGLSLESVRSEDTRGDQFPQKLRHGVNFVDAFYQTALRSGGSEVYDELFDILRSALTVHEIEAIEDQYQ